MDLGTISSPIVVLDYGYDESLEPVIRAAADGLGVKVHNHLHLNSIPTDALVIGCYADTRVHDIQLAHRKRGIENGINPDFLTADINHFLLNPENQLSRGDCALGGRLILGRLIPDYVPYETQNADATLAEWGIETQGWRNGGEYILACPPKDELIPFLEQWTAQSKRPFSMAQWKANIERASQASKKPIVWRTRDSTTPLEDDLRNAAVLAHVQSGLGVQALVRGIPVLGVDGLCPVGNARPDIDWNKPLESGVVRPREPLLAQVLQHQLTTEQMRDPARIKQTLAWQAARLQAPERLPSR